MKTILVPTDFSKAAGNSAEYAAELAKNTKSKIVLFHVYHVPIPVPESNSIPIAMIDPETLEKANIDRLEIEALYLTKKTGIQVECISKMGFAVEEINNLEKELKPDLIIMGIKGSGAASEFILGSTTTDVIKSSIAPILVIPEKTKFKMPDKIALACDYKTETNPKVFKPLKDFSKIFCSRLFIVNILQENEEIEHDKEMIGLQLENNFEDMDHTYHFPKDNDAVHGLNEFIKSNQIDILSIIPHKHNLLERLFKSSTTKKIAFHSEIPLLALPDNNY